jgi:hypothetical protein
MPCEAGLEDEDTAFLILMSLERDRDRLDVDIAEKNLELYHFQGGGVSGPQASAAAPEDSKVQAETSPSTVERARFRLPQKDGRGQFLALTNAKGSCRLRRFDAETGTAFPKEATSPGDYRTAFYQELRRATPLTVIRQPNLEGDCRDRLRPDILRELQNQIQSAPGEA